MKGQSIESVEAIPFRLPTVRPVRFANGAVSEAEHVLVRIRTHDGAVGFGEASPRPMTYGDGPRAVCESIERRIGPALVGQDACQIEGLHARLTNLVRNETAKAAVDVALWDLLGKRASMPIARILGGGAKRVAVSHLLGLGTPSEMAAEAEQMSSELGIRAFKVKVGLSAAEDVQRVLSVRSVVGDDAIIYLDANHGWTASEALDVVRALERANANPAWLEEPNPASNDLDRRWLAQRIDLPIVADESAIDLASAARELTSGRAHRLSLKAGRAGFSINRQLVGLALGLGAEVVVGSQVEGRLGVAATVHLAAAFSATMRYPAELTAGLAYREDLIDPLPIVDGMMTVPEAPGLGVDVDERRVEKLRLN